MLEKLSKVTKAAIDEFQADKKLRDTLTSAFKVMLDFYGLELLQDEQRILKIARKSTFNARRRHWLTPANHNFLRITRILKALSLLGLHAHAQAFLRCLTEVYEEHGTLIGTESFNYWRSAVL
jgi:hypothetical protein